MVVSTRKYPALLVLVGAIVLVQGCATSKNGAPELDSTRGKVDQVKVGADSERKLPLRVAILPFENLTDKTEAVEMVRRAFYNHFSSKKYQDVELFKVDDVLQSQSLLEQNKFLEVQPSSIGEMVGADGLIYGKITAADRIFVGVYSQVSVELEVKLVRADTGEAVWERTHRATHHEGGAPLDIIGLIPTVIRSALNMRDIELLRTSEDLAREMLADLPEPAIGEIFKPPRIELVAQDSAGKWKKTGDTIRVAMVGEPGLVASFDIGELKKGLPMVEENKGAYSGYYKVMPGDMLNHGLVIGRLADDRGNRSEWVDPLGAVDIDTKAPEPPQELEALGRDGSVFVKWAEAKEFDILEYRLYRSETPKDGYNEIGRTQLNKYQDEGVKNGRPYYYRASSVDRAGNESVYSDCVWTVPSIPGPTTVSGAIKTDTVWHAAASPYIIKKRIEVMNGATLTVEAGTVVRSEGEGLVVRGKLLAVGRKDSLIQFLGTIDDESGVTWDGILFDNTGDSESKVMCCKIKQARTALALTSSSPALSQNLITENGKGILLREFSKPVITGNVVVNNREEGLICERSDPEITGNTIKENLKGGIHCRHASPVVSRNNLLANQGFDLQAETMSETIVAALNNWWGSTDAEKIRGKIKGPVMYASVLDAPYPGGKMFELSVQKKNESMSIPAQERAKEAGHKIDAKEIPNLIKKAQGQMSEARHQEAAKTLLEIVGADETNHRAWFLLGMSYFQSGNPAEALKSMEKAVGLDPNNPGYRYNLGLAYNEAGSLSRALQEWRKVMHLDPGNQNSKMLLDLYDQKDPDRR